MRLTALISVLGILALGSLSWALGHAIFSEITAPRDLHGMPHAGSRACEKCHAKEHESWSRTFHRTMTQEAHEGSVLGRFDGTELEYFGVTAKMDRTDDGRFRMTFTEAGSLRRRSVLVTRTVGSRRVQQYLARQGDLFVRLPVAWLVDEARFIHMNGAFLTPDPEPPPPGRAVARADYDRHVTRWNDNCIFCHNVAPNPGRTEDGVFTSTTAELGIACEACHGPAAAHAAANGNPLRRYALHFTDRPDPTIVNPRRLSPEQRADLCGRCHGQRKTDDIERFLTDGDPFVPGDDLSRFSEPLFRDTALDGDDAVFAPRFWADGTPRLTAYEYQGWLESPCTGEGDLTCTDCHGMHEGDPRGQIRPDREGNAACRGCHGDLAPDHSRHRKASSGSSCAACHMPRIVYGLIDAHRSHRIEVPDPAASEAHDRPDACTLCHVDQTRAWAKTWRARLWNMPAPEAPEAADPALPETLRALYGGDPIERAIAARALGESPLGDPEDKRGALLDAMRDDPYPAVRRIAWRALRRLAPDVPEPAFRAYRPASTPKARKRALEGLIPHLPPHTLPPPSQTAPLRALAQTQAIQIGE